jgi:hypothetical protein
MSEMISYAELQARKENRAVTWLNGAILFENPDVNAWIAIGSSARSSRVCIGP